MVTTAPTIDEVWSLLGSVMDPEIPVISIVDLGIVRDVAYRDDRLYVTITPTYSGCPATMVIDALIREALAANGAHGAHLEVQLAPAWTTDWLTSKGRIALKAYGIAPPAESAAALGVSILRRPEARVACPSCNSLDVALTSRFGSTPCKALYRCNACREPFDHFKCH